MVINLCRNWDQSQSLKTAAPELSSFGKLKEQFQWLVDGPVVAHIHSNLAPQLRNLELYLRYSAVL